MPILIRYLCLFLLISSSVFGADLERKGESTLPSTSSLADANKIRVVVGTASQVITWADMKVLIDAYGDTVWQGIDADLTAIAGLSGTSGFLTKTGTNTWELNTNTYLTTTGSAASLTDFPTLNQNTTGTAANVSGTPALPNGTTATTQTAADNSTKLATTAYADAAAGARQADMGITSITDSTSTTSSTAVASATAVKAAYDHYPTITDSTSTESSTTVASATAVKAAYDLANGKQASDATLTALAGVTLADVSVIEGTGTDTFSVVTSAGNNYFLGSNSDNSALEFKTPANVLSQIGAQAAGSYQASDSDLTSLAAISGVRGDLFYYGASGWTKLAKGTENYYLKQGADDPSWSTVTGTMTWPSSAGVANYSGSSSWGTSYTVGTGASNLVQLNASAELPAVSAVNLTNIPGYSAGTDGTYGITQLNNTARSPTAATDELYFEGNIFKINQNGTESTSVIGPYDGQISFTGPTQARALKLADAAGTVGTVPSGAWATGKAIVTTSTEGIFDQSDIITNPMSAVGDLVIGGTSGTPERLAKGTEGYVLTAGAVTVGWAAQTASLTNPMSAVGDMIIGDTAGAPARLADVAAGQPLLSGGVATAPAYAGYTFSATAAQTYTFPSTSKTLAASDGSNISSLPKVSSTVYAATTSAELAGVLSDETGTGAAVFGTGPAISSQEVDGSASGNLTVAQMSGSIIYNTGMGGADVALTLPTAAAGLSAQFVVGTAQSYKWGVRAGASDKIYLLNADGTISAGSDNGYARMTNAQIGQCFVCSAFKTDAYDWMCKAVAIGTSTFAAN